MSTIEITKPFTMPRKELREQLGDLAHQLGNELRLDCEWHSEDCLGFSRSGAEGEVNIGDDEIELTMRLGILMELFRDRIEREIHEFIDEHIY